MRFRDTPRDWCIIPLNRIERACNMRVSLLLTCTADLLYPASARACVRVLETLGVQVDFPHLQTCCGQPWLNTGHLDGARRLALHFLEVFEKADTVVAISSSCADNIRNHYAELFPGSPELQQRLELLGQRTYEFCEYLYKVLNLRCIPRHPRTHRTTYHSSCRTLRGIGLNGAAEDYLAQMLGEEFIPLPDNESCCGFGGNFSVKLPEISGGLMADKLQNIASTKASHVVSLDLSCLSHLSAGASRLGLGKLRFSHLGELLAEALGEFTTQAEEQKGSGTSHPREFFPRDHETVTSSGGCAPGKIHDFRAQSAKAVANDGLRGAVRKTADLLLERRAAAAAGYPGFEDLRSWGRTRKMEVSSRLAEYVARFADRVKAAGGVVHFAKDAAEAVEAVKNIATKHRAFSAVKSKSMTAEEISLNEALALAGIRVTETDLGEFIIQLAHEKPSHLLAPAIHKSRAQVAELLHAALGIPPGLDVEGMVRAARNVLRRKFLSAQLGITGANFAVAETGSVVLVTNEGNGRMTTSLPPVQITILGIDKIIPKLSDLPGFLTLLTRSACGQVISSYVSIITGPRKQNEEEGPEELHVVLLDNGRSSLADGPFREILHCLHCGACLNHCPVYRTIGGHAYQSVYPGPFGDVLSPQIWGMANYPDLPDACTLCGRCATACPVGIPLPDLHRKLRTLRTREQTCTPLTDRLCASMSANPFLYRGSMILLRQILTHGRRFPAGMSPTFLENWKTCRDLPQPQPGPAFRDWWHDKERKTH